MLSITLNKHIICDVVKQFRRNLFEYAIFYLPPDYYPRTGIVLHGVTLWVCLWVFGFMGGSVCQERVQIV